MIRKFYLFTFVCLSHMVVAQQDPLYSQYLTNPLLFNPAYAGLNNAFNASLSFRNQWAGFEGSPSTVNLNSHLSVVDNKVGLGGMVLRDVLGPTKNTEIHFTGSYKLQLDKADKYMLSFGMQVGMISSNNNYSQLNLDNPADPAFAQDLNFVWPNVGFGAILKADQFLVGLSVPRMLKARKSDGGPDFLLYNQHLYLFGSYVYYVGTRFRLKPSVLLRGVQGAPLSADINFNINIDQKYTAGIFVRNFTSYGLMGQIWFLEKFRFGYAFELPGNKSVGPQFTSHEITLGIKTAVLNSHDRSYSEF